MVEVFPTIEYSLPVTVKGTITVLRNPDDPEPTAAELLEVVARAMDRSGGMECYGATFYAEIGTAEHDGNVQQERVA